MATHRAGRPEPTTVVLCSEGLLPSDAIWDVQQTLGPEQSLEHLTDGLHCLQMTGPPQASGHDRDALLTILRSLPADVAWSLPSASLATQGPALVVSDVDSTLVTTEVIEELAEHAGTRGEVAEITERAMAGELDFAASLRERVATLRGVPERVFADVAARLELSPGAERLVERARASGVQVALVSGGFHDVVDRIAEPLGIEFVRANRLEVRDGLLTGRTIGPVIDRAAKEQALFEFAGRLGVPVDRCVAIGDGANDLTMLEAAGLGVAYRAKPVVRAATSATIGFPRLDAAWWLAGGH